MKSLTLPAFGLLMLATSCMGNRGVENPVAIQTEHTEGIIVSVNPPKHFDVDLHVPELRMTFKAVANRKHFNNWREIKIGDTVMATVIKYKGISRATGNDTTFWAVDDHALATTLMDIYD